MTEAVQQALSAAGMPRTSRLNGGAVTGWTTNYGSTGFSLRENKEGQIAWHVVISGKPLLRYRKFKEIQGDEDLELHEPTNPEALCARIKQVFEGVGLTVLGVE